MESDQKFHSALLHQSAECLMVRLPLLQNITMIKLSPERASSHFSLLYRQSLQMFHTIGRFLSYCFGYLKFKGFKVASPQWTIDAHELHVYASNNT